MNIDKFSPIDPLLASDFFRSTYTSENSKILPKSGTISISSENNIIGNNLRQCFSSLQKTNITPSYDLGYLKDSVSLEISNNIHIHISSAAAPIAHLDSKTSVVTVSNKTSLPINDNNTFIAYQRQISGVLISEQSKNLSLGNIRSNNSIVEPLLRDTSVLVFNMSALRRSEVRGEINSLPTGLYSEEACQILRYAGESPKLNIVNIIASDNDTDLGIKLMLIAQLIWYFIEGASHIIEDTPHSDPKSFDTYLVGLENIDASLSFHKHIQSGKWWISSLSNDNEYIACSLEDYESAIQGNLSNRLLHLI